MIRTFRKEEVENEFKHLKIYQKIPGLDSKWWEVISSIQTDKKIPRDVWVCVDHIDELFDYSTETWVSFHKCSTWCLFASRWISSPSSLSLSLCSVSIYISLFSHNLPVYVLILPPPNPCPSPPTREYVTRWIILVSLICFSQSLSLSLSLSYPLRPLLSHWTACVSLPWR